MSNFQHSLYLYDASPSENQGIAAENRKLLDLLSNGNTRALFDQFGVQISIEKVNVSNKGVYIQRMVAAGFERGRFPALRVTNGTIKYGFAEITAIYVKAITNFTAMAQQTHQQSRQQSEQGGPKYKDYDERDDADSVTEATMAKAEDIERRKQMVASSSNHDNQSRPKKIAHGSGHGHGKGKAPGDLDISPETFVPSGMLKTTFCKEGRDLEMENMLRGMFSETMMP